MKLLLLCLAGFISAFVDSIAGGGGLISVPAFMLYGLPPHIVLGTNKFAATTASLTSSIKYITSGTTNKKLLKFLGPMSFLGAVIGVNIVLKINQKYLYGMVLVLILAVGVYTLFSKTIGTEDKFEGLNRKNIIMGMLFAFLIGGYDGFFGPGTGSFLIFGLINIYGFNFLNAGGNARFLNFLSNIASLLVFAYKGMVDYKTAVPVAIFMIIGARLGTKAALYNGSKFIKPIFVTMSLLVATRMLYNLFQ
ncbi:hypothetical protein ABG79_01961 [Caloramator mitchellensis]|uniref:Probable membrane transporter protein n=1 Tax=Caloramator mitchellensis TaxID=908809 RepID=A0A0R3JYK2_CALMK|nr:TSUP family transporter [Caloramator mitchellensis]KRQ86228.1 hypothetical protein ABG79_01961 [Caloramator mitchellensis]